MSSTTSATRGSRTAAGIIESGAGIRRLRPIRIRGARRISSGKCPGTMRSAQLRIRSRVAALFSTVSNTMSLRRIMTSFEYLMASPARMTRPRVSLSSSRRVGAGSVPGRREIPHSGGQLALAHDEMKIMSLQLLVGSARACRCLVRAAGGRIPTRARSRTPRNPETDRCCCCGRSGGAKGRRPLMSRGVSPWRFRPESKGARLQ